MLFECCFGYLDSTPDKHRPNVHLRKRSISNFGSTAQSLDLGNVSDSPVQLDKKKGNFIESYNCYVLPPSHTINLYCCILKSLLRFWTECQH